MSETFQPAAQAYSQANESTFRDGLRRLFRFFLRSDRDVELQPNVRLIMTDTDGQRWAFTVNTSGDLESHAL